ncbi:outer membrane protein assembly factor BamB family protein [Halorussus ruber]|uniref:outer membrane protein assembly factor BamB family protein n=1 Tax=Halorussus ruber TaxID=1126238 RepID=UPI00109333D4|nr:PQQ-binding-like beta-propeller repeat protein [Halorussus ruber]
MVPRETGRREFLLGAGAAGVGATIDGKHAASGLGAPAVSVPDLDADHRVRWEFEADTEESFVYPVASADGAVFTYVRRHGSEADTRDAVYAFERETGETRWKRETNDLPVVRTTSANRIYLRGEQGLQALDTADGSVKWRYDLEDIRLREFVVGEGIAVGAFGSGLIAFNAEDGTERWRIPLGDGPQQSETPGVSNRVRGLTVAGDALYFGNTEEFTALSLADGERRWYAPIEEDIAWPGAVRDGLLVGWSDGAVYGVEVESGQRRFRTEVGHVRAHDSGGTVGERAAYVWGDRFTAVDLRTGGKRWTYTADGTESGPSDGRGSSPVVGDGLVFTSTGEESVVALDADSGRERWQFDSETAFGRWGEVRNGFVYVTGPHRIHALEAGSGREQWSLEIGDENDTTWAIAFGDSVFVGTRNGRLYAVDPPSRLVTAPVETATEFATTSSGLGLLGLLGAGLLGVGYRHAKRRASATDRDADLELGRLARLDSGPLTETYLKRVQTPDGPELVAETRLSDSAGPDARRAVAAAVENWAALDAASPASGLLPVRDYGTDPEPWFETPYLSGGSLADSWPRSYRERVEVASAVARALHAAHREEVVHGRLAPRHVLRGGADDANRRRVGDPEVRVGGWFLADALDEVREDSDPYAPPEVRNGGESANSVAGDVYRVGALAAHLLTGEVPGPSSEAEVESGPKSELGSSSESGSPATAGLPDELAAVLTRALADDPEARHDSALAFDDEFRWAALDR